MLVGDLSARRLGHADRGQINNNHPPLPKKRHDRTHAGDHHAQKPPVVTEQTAADPNGAKPSATDNNNADDKQDGSASTGDRFVSQYMIFLASVDEENGGSYAERAQQLNDDVAKMQQVATGDSPQPSESTATVSNLSANVAYSQSLAAAYATDGSQFAFAAAYHAEFHADVSGQVTLPDGSTASFQGSVDFALDFQVGVFGSQGTPPPPQQKGDPLALDIDGDGDISLSDVDSGAVFDLNGDGQPDRTSFVRGNDVFLGFDRNGNGLIDDGGELFGDQHGASNGFLELGKFDSDHNGKIDKNDFLYSALVGARLGQGGAIETKSLAELGVDSINLNYLDRYTQAQSNNAITQQGSYTDSAGRTRLAADVLLNYQPLNAQA